MMSWFKIKKIVRQKPQVNLQFVSKLQPKKWGRQLVYTNAKSLSVSHQRIFNKIDRV